MPKDGDKPIRLEVPGIGTISNHEDIDNWLATELIPIPVLGNRTRRIVLEDTESYPPIEDYYAAIRNFLAIDHSALATIEQEVYDYYEVCNASWDDDEEEFVHIDRPVDVWGHVRFGTHPCVKRHFENLRVYVSVECECDWEHEHGLQIVFRDGLEVNKIGAFDGHLINHREGIELEGVIYDRHGQEDL